MLKQVYIDKNVVDAAWERLEYIFDEFPNVNVSISGGKDSTVLCWMALQVARRRGRRIGVFFLDEEVVYQSTVEQVRYLMSLDPEHTIRMWYQFEFKLTNATSYADGQLICWEEGKHDIWMRPKEPYSVQHMPWDPHKLTIRDANKGFGFYDVLENFERNQPPHTAFLVGLRATESMNRFRAVAKNPGYKDVFWCTRIGAPEDVKAAFYPLYDWNFHDVWKFIYDNGIRYSRIYDYQWKKGMHLQEIRVSSLIHEKSFKALCDLPEFEPKTFDRLCKRVRGIQVGHLYGKDRKLLRCQSLPKNYKTWLEYRDFLLSTYPDESKRWIFERRFANQLNNNFVARQQCRQLILNDYENNLPVRNQEDPREATLRKWRELL